jgi:hypothetical protein
LIAEGRRPEKWARKEEISIRDDSRAQVQSFRLRPRDGGYGGPTYGALLKSIQKSNACLKI